MNTQKSTQKRSVCALSSDNDMVFAANQVKRHGSFLSEKPSYLRPKKRSQAAKSSFLSSPSNSSYNGSVSGVSVRKLSRKDTKFLIKVSKGIIRYSSEIYAQQKVLSVGSGRTINLLDRIKSKSEILPLRNTRSKFHKNHLKVAKNIRSRLSGIEKEDSGQEDGLSTNSGGAEGINSIASSRLQLDFSRLLGRERVYSEDGFKVIDHLKLPRNGSEGGFQHLKHNLSVPNSPSIFQNSQAEDSESLSSEEQDLDSPKEVKVLKELDDTEEEYIKDDLPKTDSNDLPILNLDNLYQSFGSDEQFETFRKNSKKQKKLKKVANSRPGVNSSKKFKNREYFTITPEFAKRVEFN